MIRYFVWVNGLRGPEGQIWDDDKKYREGKLIKTLAAPVKLLSPDDRSLDKLKEDYPYEAKT